MSKLRCNKDLDVSSLDITKCKCAKSSTKVCSSYFEDVATRIQDRRCDLVGKHKYLREKITILERSIPALMAYNMWMTDQDCQDAPYCKVREIMKRLSPYPGPTERLLDELKTTVKELNQETAELHEKIINADMQLEETEMELESLELANKEMGEKVDSLEKEVRAQGSPSLHSIHSEDLICLTKIRQLAKEELSLKYYIRELEEKEILFKEQIDRLLTSKEFQNCAGTRRMIERIQELESNEKKMHCALQTHKHNMHQLRKKLLKKEKELARLDAAAAGKLPIRKLDTDKDEKSIDDKAQEIQSEEGVGIEKSSSWESDALKSCACRTPTPLPCYEKSSGMRKRIQKKSSKSKASNISSTSCKICAKQIYCIEPISRGKTCRCNTTASNRSMPCNKSMATFSRKKPLCSKKPLCEPPPCAVIKTMLQQSKLQAPCDFGNPCDTCQPTPCRECMPERKPDGCRCDCKGKCARGLSEMPCNCGTSADPSDKGYQPTGIRSTDSTSDDEYCECCSCGCAVSDPEVDCRCN